MTIENPKEWHHRLFTAGTFRSPNDPQPETGKCFGWLSIHFNSHIFSRHKSPPGINLAHWQSIDIHWPQKVNRTWHHMTPLMTRYFKACHVCILARRTHEDAEAPTASTGIPARTIIRSSSRSERAARNTSHFQNLTQICPWTSLWIHERGPIWSHQCPSGGSMVKVSRVSKCASAAAVHVCPPFVPCPPPFPPMAKLARSCAHIAHTCCLILFEWPGEECNSPLGAWKLPICMPLILRTWRVQTNRQTHKPVQVPAPKFPILQTLWKLQGRTCLWSSFKAPGRQRRWLVNHLPKATEVRVLKGHDFVAQMVPIRRKLIISEGQPWPTLTSQFCTA